MGIDRTRPTAAGVILLLALTSCASTRTPEADAASPPPSTPDVVRAPPDVAGYALADSVRYPQPELGTAYRYRGDGPLRPDVYIYPSQPGSTLDKQAASFRRVLEINRRRGRYTDFRIGTERAWSPVAWAEGREVVAVLRFGNRFRDSYFHVFDVGELFVKVRVTNARGEVTAEEVRAFAEALLTAMAGDATSVRTTGVRSVLRR